MYRHDNFSPFFKIVQWLLLIEMVFASCSDTVDSDYRWVVKETNERLTGKQFLLVGEWWKIDCRMNDNTVNATLWQRQIWKKPFHIQRVVDGKDIKMIEKNVFNITKLRATDQGRYFCKADCGKEKYAGGIYVNKGVVFATPTIIKIPSDRISKYGSSIILSCEVDGSYGSYEMKWFNVFSRKLMPSKDMSSSSESRVVQRKVLTISNLNKNDEATYECQLKRRIVHHTALAAVNITMEDLYSKPILTDNFVDQPILHVEENGSVTLKYIVGGKPHPNITWYKLENGKEEKIAWCSQKSNTCKTNNKRVKITNCSFTIQGLGFTKNNNVSYICRAENILGTSSKKYTVLIKRKPSLNRNECTDLIHTNTDGSRRALSRDNHQIPAPISNKVTQTALWRFGTIAMGTLLLVALFFNYRERKWRKKYIMEFQAMKCGGTKV